MSSIYTLAYASSSTHLLSETELEKLLALARRMNKKSNVTGMLLYHDGNFLQLLEGSEENVRETFNRIELDRRHKGIIPLLTRSFPKRSFPEWSMGYVRCTEKKLDPDEVGFNVILEKDRIPFLQEHHMPGPIKDLLRSFHRIVYKTNMKIVESPYLTFSQVL